jgi:RNA polymerase sigma factor (TIGR02999 family)
MRDESGIEAGQDNNELLLDNAFSAIYSDLKQRARASLSRLPHGQTLTPTSLVSEAYVKLSAAEDLTFNDKRHFYALAARAMRHIILDHARSAMRLKRGGELQAVTLNDADLKVAHTAEALLDLASALDELGQMSPRQRELIELRFFAGLDMPAAAELLDLPLRSAWREWNRARAFLQAQMCA